MPYTSAQGISPTRSIPNPYSPILVEGGDLIIAGMSGEPQRFPKGAIGQFIGVGPEGRVQYLSMDKKTTAAFLSSFYTKWDPLCPPLNPSALDDEFTGDTLDPKWTRVKWDDGVDFDTTSYPGKLYAKLKTSSATRNNWGIVQPLPTTGDWTVITQVDSLQPNGDVNYMGLVLTEGTAVTNKLTWWVTGYFAGPMVFSERYVDWNAVAVASTPLSKVPIASRIGVFLRIYKSATNYFFGWSLDGVIWTDYNVTANLGIIPTHAGLLLQNFNSTAPPAEATFDFFRVYPYAKAKPGSLISVGSNLSNPMLQDQDLIVGGQDGAPTRMAVGAPGHFMGVDLSGKLGYFKVDALPPQQGNDGKFLSTKAGKAEWAELPNFTDLTASVKYLLPNDLRNFGNNDLNDPLTSAATLPKWIQVNWDQAKVSYTPDRMKLDLSGGTAPIRALLKPLPTGDLTLWTEVIGGTKNFSGAGLILADGISPGSGSQCFLGLAFSTSTLCRLEQWTNFQTQGAVQNVSTLTSSLLWVRLRRVEGAWFAGVSSSPDAPMWEEIPVTLNWVPTYAGVGFYVTNAQTSAAYLRGFHARLATESVTPEVHIISEAPKDGQIYARKGGEWTTLGEQSDIPVTVPNVVLQRQRMDIPVMSQNIPSVPKGTAHVITDGMRLAQITITPKRIGSKIRVKTSTIIYHSLTTVALHTSLYVNGSVNSVRDTWGANPMANWPVDTVLEYEIQAYSLSPIQFEVRGGCEADSSGVLYTKPGGFLEVEEVNDLAAPSFDSQQFDSYTFFDPDKPSAKPTALDDDFSALLNPIKWASVNDQAALVFDSNSTTPDRFHIRIQSKSEIAALLQPLPPGDFTAYTKLDGSYGLGAGQGFFGLMLSDTKVAGGGKQWVFGCRHSNVDPYQTYYGRYTGFNTNVDSGLFSNFQNTRYLGIRRIGTEFHLGMSPDGVAWTWNAFATIPPFFGKQPTHIGLFGSSSSGGPLCDFTFDFFRFFPDATSKLGGERRIGVTPPPTLQREWSFDNPPINPSPWDDEFSKGPELDPGKWPLTFNMPGSGFTQDVNKTVPGKLFCNVVPPGNTEVGCYAVQRMPQGDFVCWTKVKIPTNPGNHTLAGLYLLDSTTKRCVLWGLHGNQGTLQLGNRKDGVTWEGNLTGETSYPSNTVLLRIKRVGLTFTYGYSSDGDMWTDIFSHIPSAEVSPRNFDHIGLSVFGNNVSYYLTFDYFRISQDVNSLGGGYTKLPLATATTHGVMKAGTGLKVDSEGTVSLDAPGNPQPMQMGYLMGVPWTPDNLSPVQVELDAEGDLNFYHLGASSDFSSLHGVFVPYTRAKRRIVWTVGEGGPNSLGALALRSETGALHCFALNHDKTLWCNSTTSASTGMTNWATNLATSPYNFTDLALDIDANGKWVWLRWDNKRWIEITSGSLSFVPTGIGLYHRKWGTNTTSTRLLSLGFREYLDNTPPFTSYAIQVPPKPATATSLGAIKVGKNLVMEPDGTLNAAWGLSDPPAPMSVGYLLGVPWTEDNQQKKSMPLVTQEGGSLRLESTYKGGEFLGFKVNLPFRPVRVVATLELEASGDNTFGIGLTAVNSGVPSFRAICVRPPNTAGGSSWGVTVFQGGSPTVISGESAPSQPVPQVCHVALDITDSGVTVSYWNGYRWVRASHPGVVLNNLSNVSQIGVYVRSNDTTKTIAYVHALYLRQIGDTSRPLDSTLFTTAPQPDLFSLDEVKTNKVWIDGKPIYRKVIDMGVLTCDGTDKTFPHGVPDIDSFNEQTCVLVNQAGNVFRLGQVNSGNGGWVNKQSINYQCPSSWSGGTKGLGILEYTKVNSYVPPVPLLRALFNEGLGASKAYSSGKTGFWSSPISSPSYMEKDYLALRGSISSLFFEDASLKLDDKPCTVGMWVRNYKNAGILTTGADYGYRAFKLNGTSTPELGLGLFAANAASGVVLPIGVWVHVAWAVDKAGSRVRFFLNGAPVSEKSGTYIYGHASLRWNLSVDALADIRDLRIYDVLLTDAEVFKIFSDTSRV